MWYKLAQQLQLPGLDVEQSQPKSKEKSEPKAKSPELLETQKEPKSLFFDDWAKDHYVPERPLYHGTTRDFDKFDINKGMSSNYFGPAFYFTSDESDATENYTGTGPDQIRNIENIQYNLIDEYNDDEYSLIYYKNDPRYSKYFNEDGTTFNLQLLTQKIAEDSVLGENNPKVIPAHVRMKNPIYLTNESDEEHPEQTYIDDVDGDVSFLDELQVETSDLNSYKTVITKLRNILMDYFDSDVAYQICEELVEETTGSVDGKVSATMMMNFLMSKLEFRDSDLGTRYKGEIIKRFLNELGHDSIIMNPNEFFRMYSKDKPIKHYITWDPENIKHTRENLEFNPSNPVITANRGKINLWKNSLL
jgi:hypothetical protein